MKRATLLLTVASIMYVVAWFLPVVDGGTTLAKGGLPGWEAVRVALSPIWDRDVAETWWGDLLAVLSGLTNGWFLFSVADFKVAPKTSHRFLFWGTIVALLLNAHWFLLGDPRSDLRIGYYLWLASFAALAGAAHWARSVSRAPAAA